MLCALLLLVVVGAGHSFTLARTREGDRHAERRLKRRREAPQLCPICSGAAAVGRARRADATRARRTGEGAGKRSGGGK